MTHDGGGGLCCVLWYHAVQVVGSIALEASKSPFRHMILSAAPTRIFCLQFDGSYAALLSISTMWHSCSLLLPIEHLLLTCCVRVRVRVAECRLIVYKKHEGQSYTFYRECMCEAPKQFKPGKKNQQTGAYGIAVSPLQPHQLIGLMSDSNLYTSAHRCGCCCCLLTFGTGGGGTSSREAAPRGPAVASM